MKAKKLIGILLVLCMITGFAAGAGSFNASAQTDAQAYLDEMMEDYGLSGAVIVTKNGKVVCQSARGMANSAEGKEMTLDTLFPIGSNSKQFCAVAILMLQEQGKLSVDDTLAKYFPEYEAGKDITIENLLAMRSGIREHQEGLFNGYNLSVDATSEENIQTILEWLYTQKLLFKPGKSHRYANTNYLLLSMIVEQASGQSYGEFITENIFEPLEMNNSGFYEELMNHPDLAEYTAEDYSPIDPELKGLTKGCGDLVSTVEDMDKWLTSLSNCTLISKESFDAMTTDYSKGTGYGYGVRLQEDGAVFHDGAIVSYLSFTFTYPEKGFNVFGVTNDIMGKGNQLMNLVFELAEEFKDIEVSVGLCGDVNCDEKVNVRDATEIQKHIAGLSTLPEGGYAVADVDASGGVNVKDATAIQKHIAGMETGYPIGEQI